jgi:hypothetical protein
MSQPTVTFQAKRTYSSGEYLALKRQKAEQVHIPLKSNNLQDSSELTARVRKFSSVMGTDLPFLPTQGNSTNMVKWRDASVVQAMKEGQAYRASTVAAEPIKYPLPCTSVLNQFIDTQFTYATDPKATVCPVQDRGKYWIGRGYNPLAQPFSLKEHFGMANEIKNTKLYVPSPQAVCRSCDLIDK